jgi:hypothetical protein
MGASEQRKEDMEAVPSDELPSGPIGMESEDYKFVRAGCGVGFRRYQPMVGDGRTKRSDINTARILV